MISKIFKYFLHSNIPYVLFIWQSRIICTKNSFIFNAIFWKIFMEYIKTIFSTGSIEFLLLFKKSRHSKNLVKYWQGYLRLKITMWGCKKKKKTVKKCHCVLLIIFYFNLPLIFIPFSTLILLQYFNVIAKNLNYW